MHSDTMESTMMKLFAVCPEQIDVFDTGFRVSSKDIHFDNVLIKCVVCTKTHVLKSNMLICFEVPVTKAAKKVPAI